MRSIKFLSVVAALIGSLSLLLASVSFRAPDANAQSGIGPAASGLVVAESTQSFEATWTSLIEALNANPNIGIMTEVDHGAAAEDAGLTLDNNRVVFFGNPALGTPIMQASRTAGIDLPQKMQVFEEDGRIYVAYNPPSYLAARHGTGQVASLSQIGGALAGLAQAATNSEVTSVITEAQPAPGAGLVTTASANDFDTTWTNLLAAIDGSPASVAFMVDHAANAGGSLPPTRLVVFGNPAIGTPMMADAGSAGVDLPLKILVYEDDAGLTHVVSSSASYVQARHGLGQVATVGAATNAIAAFTSAATTGPAGETAADIVADTASEDEVLGITELAVTGNDLAVAVTGFGLLAIGGAMVISGRRRD